MTSENNQLNIQDKHLRMFLKNGFVFSGICKTETADFITILDDRTGQDRILAKSELRDIEVRS